MTEARYLFCYHKSGTVLMSKLFARVAPMLGWPLTSHLGLVSTRPVQHGVHLFMHSLLGFNLQQIAHRGVRIIRDPRDIWLSGYLYHKRCREGWCTNVPDPTRSPIAFPNVPYSQQHKSEEWKRAYLAGLCGKSYQRNLLERSLEEGLRFEAERYAEWTTEAMSQWVPTDHTIDIRLEDFSVDYDATLRRLFLHLGVATTEMGCVVEACSAENVQRMSAGAIRANRHIHSRAISKWREMIPEAILGPFEARHEALIRHLGYELIV